MNKTFDFSANNKDSFMNQSSHLTNISNLENNFDFSRNSIEKIEKKNGYFI